MENSKTGDDELINLDFLDDIADTVSSTVNNLIGNNTSTNNIPANNKPTNNSPANNTPANNTPANNTPANNKLSNNAPANNAPANNKPANNKPSNKEDGGLLDFVFGGEVQAPQVVGKKGVKDEPLTLKTFYAARAKNPSLYNYDGRGNLVVREENGSIKTTLALPKYRKLSPEELEDLEEKRRQTIQEVEEEYVKASNELHQLIDDYNNGRKLQYQLKDAQLRLADLDMRRSLAYYPKQFNAYFSESLQMKDIFYDAKSLYGKRALPFPVVKKYLAQHDPANYWVRAMTEDEEANEEAIAAQKAEEDVRIGNGDEPGIRSVNRGLEPLRAEPDKNLIILFNRPEDDVKWGVFANDFPIEFNWRGIKYFTVDQALAAEKARFFGKAESVAEIMRTRSAVTMRSIAKKIGEPPSEGGTLMAPKAGEVVSRPIVETDAEKAAREKRTEEWTTDRFSILKSILLSKFRQHEYLADILKSTGDATLARADHRDMEDGIGIAITDPRCEQPAMWRGKNLLGKALMEVRTEMRLATTNGEDVGAATKTENTITAEEDVAASKAKATMTIRRRRAAKASAVIPPPSSMPPLNNH